MRQFRLIAASGIFLLCGLGLASAHQGAHIESTTGTLSSVTNAYYTLSPSDSQYALPGAIGANSANCPVGFTYQAPTTWPFVEPARCLHGPSGQVVKAWVMVDLKEECEANPLPGGANCRAKDSTSCGDALWVRSQANCSSCATSYTSVFLSVDGLSWTHAKTISNSGSTVTTTYIETYSDYRYALLGLPGVTLAQTPRWQHVYTVPPPFCL